MNIIFGILIVFLVIVFSVLIFGPKGIKNFFTKVPEGLPGKYVIFKNGKGQYRWESQEFYSKLNWTCGDEEKTYEKARKAAWIDFLEMKEYHEKNDWKKV